LVFGCLVAAAAVEAAPRGAADQGAARVETRFIQVHPAAAESKGFVRSTDKRRAVVLIHGYWLHFTKTRVHQALFKPWQEKGSPLVTTLGKDSDVFAFAYGQTVSVEAITQLPGLKGGIDRLRQLGYSEIVLLGHSAGGLVAREFVENCPRAGVTKVVQICAPNGGTAYAEVGLIPKNQKAFVASLAPAARQKCLQARADKKIPAGVQFVCLVGADDAVVPCRCQWTRDLQDQGIPVLCLHTGHRQIMRRTPLAQKIAEVIRTPQPRWKANQVAAARLDVFKPRNPVKDMGKGH
jgi:pimeloyl-ACP methyl ester carboxylesterase